MALLRAPDATVHPVFLDEDQAGFLLSNLTPEHTGLPFYVWVENRGPARHDIRVWAWRDVRSLLADRICIAIPPEVRVLQGEFRDDDLNALCRWVTLNLAMIEKHWDGEASSLEVYEMNQPITP